MTTGAASPNGDVTSAAQRIPAMEAVSISRDFSLGRRQTLRAVRDVSLSLYRGTVVALVGESGSGKSTVARLLAGQEALTSGSIKLHGQPVSLSSRRAFRQHKTEVQLVFQDPFASLNPAHTVRYHLQRPVRLHQGKHSRDEVGHKVTTLLDQVRLVPAGHFAGKYPHELSGGQRQRVSFARALAAEPSVLLADEPVSMLDVSIRLEMLGLLDDLRRRFQLALLYITHDIASARYFADEVLVMYAGQIVERGPAEELTQRPAHPYTQLLIASAPDPDNLGSILRRSSPPGAAGPPEAAGPPGAVGPGAVGPQDGRGPLGSGPAAAGCPFSPRCPLADDRCRQENPALAPVATGRAAACWRLETAAPWLAEPPLPRQGGGE
ncbi:MAG TPA: ABC transporter ATP-binding protein [Streptosporangiaceae bacterium]|jgi:peptide/nickel transport system ATP-binding protein|nr:ABC transporter ATP-binding protein [Streptosporangiaceae bacterium]